jgi:hypothetical protein
MAQLENAIRPAEVNEESQKGEACEDEETPDHMDLF